MNLEYFTTFPKFCLTVYTRTYNVHKYKYIFIFSVVEAEEFKMFKIFIAFQSKEHPERRRGGKGTDHKFPETPKLINAWFTINDVERSISTSP